MTQTALFDLGPKFSGITYEQQHDETRLTCQWQKVFEVMKDGRWRTLGELTAAIGGGSEAGVSARLRDLRKERFGSHTVERRRRGEAQRGLFEYRVVV